MHSIHSLNKARGVASSAYRFFCYIIIKVRRLLPSPLLRQHLPHYPKPAVYPHAHATYRKRHPMSTGQTLVQTVSHCQPTCRARTFPMASYRSISCLARLLRASSSGPSASPRACSCRPRAARPKANWATLVRFQAVDAVGAQHTMLQLDCMLLQRVIGRQMCRPGTVWQKPQRRPQAVGAAGEQQVLQLNCRLLSRSQEADAAKGGIALSM